MAILQVNVSCRWWWCRVWYAVFTVVEEYWARPRWSNAMDCVGKGWPFRKIVCWCGSRSSCGFRITFPFASPLLSTGVSQTSCHFSYSHKTWWNVWCRERTIVNPQHFGSNAVDVRIWIRINPEIRIWIPDHVWSSWHFGLGGVWTLWELLLWM